MAYNPATRSLNPDTPADFKPVLVQFKLKGRKIKAEVLKYDFFYISETGSTSVYMVGSLITLLWQSNALSIAYMRGTRSIGP